MPKRLFIISGEPSGDLHGANLVSAILEREPSIEIQCWGGDKMAKAGARVVKHIDELAFMGFAEVIANLPQILRNFSLCKCQITDFNPDMVLFIDYPGFNLRMAKFVSGLGIESAYYISPQIWAWKESRVTKIKRYIHHVFVILPFEQKFYERHGIKAEFVGHPLLDEFAKDAPKDDNFHEKHKLVDKPIISVLPGSRTQEIKKIILIIGELPEAFPNHQILVSKVSWQPLSLYQPAADKGIKIVEDSTYTLISNSEAAVVTSGTATLETALIGTPQVVVYKANALSIFLARFLVKIKYISLVNLILDKSAIKELIQKKATSINIIRELRSLLTGSENRQKVLGHYDKLRQLLGGSGASKIVAIRLLKILVEAKD